MKSLKMTGSNSGAADTPHVKGRAARAARNERAAKRRRRFIFVFVLSVLFVTDSILWAAHISTLVPYAITNDDEVICYVDNKDSAKAVMGEVIDEFAEDESDVRAINSEYRIKKAGGKQDTLSVEEASEAVIGAVKNTESGIKIVSSKLEEKTFTPEPEYEKDETMFAGDAETLKEGKDGEKKVIVSYTTVNGKTEDTDEVTTEIIDGGTPAVVAKGTLGLPKDASWEEYEGDPVASNGEDIITTAESYVGKIPYVWGGKSLETGVDCSGFVMAVYRLYGVELNYPLDKEGVSVSYADAKPGDIIHFPGHFALYAGNGKMVHAANKRAGICVSNVWTGRILSVRRIITD